MEALLKQYYDAKLAKYRKMYGEKGEHQALIGAKFALDDLMGDIKRASAIYIPEQLKELLIAEIEDAA